MLPIIPLQSQRAEEWIGSFTTGQRFVCSRPSISTRTPSEVTRTTTARLQAWSFTSENGNYSAHSFRAGYTPPHRGGVAAPVRKCREASEAAQTGKLRINSEFRDFATVSSFF